MSDIQDKDWGRLLNKIENGKCTPFLGAGCCAGAFPTGSKIAQDWAKEKNYPSALEDSTRLERVAQYLAVTKEDPKDKIQEYFKGYSPPDFSAFDEPHRVLADLPFPIYITTNYDDSMMKALQTRGKEPIQEICLWNEYLRKFNEKSIFDKDYDFQPSTNHPIVFHLHGHIKDANSLVLTEDDYYDFLIAMSKDDKMVPPRIQRAMASSSLLFLGYRLADLDFRVLFRSISSYISKSINPTHVSVQLVPGHNKKFDKEQKEKAQQYLTKYYDQLDIDMYWGTCRQFAKDLRKRWKEHKHDN